MAKKIMIETEYKDDARPPEIIEAIEKLIAENGDVAWSWWTE